MEDWKNLPAELQELMEKRMGERRAEDPSIPNEEDRRVSGRRKEDQRLPPADLDSNQNE